MSFKHQPVLEVTPLPVAAALQSLEGGRGSGARCPVPGAPWKIHLQQHRESDRFQKQVIVSTLLQPNPPPDFLPWDPFSFECYYHTAGHLSGNC